MHACQVTRWNVFLTENYVIKDTGTEETLWFCHGFKILGSPDIETCQSTPQYCEISRLWEHRCPSCSNPSPSWLGTSQGVSQGVLDSPPLFNPSLSPECESMQCSRSTCFRASVAFSVKMGGSHTYLTGYNEDLKEYMSPSIKLYSTSRSISM